MLNQNCARRRTRSGLTKLEVLVILGCIVLLIALITPSVPNARGAARRVQCLNNVRNVAMAATNFGIRNQEQQPQLESEFGGRTYGWPVSLLPYLDNAGVYRELLKGSANAETERRSLHFFACPDDPNHHGEPGGLSYAMNGGYGHFRADPKSGAVTELGTHTPEVDFDADGTVTDEEIEQAYATGLVWRSTDRARRKIKFDFVSEGDGTTQTILVAENANAGTWSSSKTMDIAFVHALEALAFERGKSSNGPLQIRSVRSGAFTPSCNRKGLVGRSPAPSSHHKGTINVAFCDGHAIAISEKIDPIVYAELMTPAGTKYGQRKELGID